MTLWSSLAIMLIVVAAAIASVGNAQTVDDPILAGVPKVQPSHVYTYPGDTWIWRVFPAPHERHVYVHWLLGSVNLWAVLVYYWPEIAAGGVLLVLALLLKRVIRRKRQTGALHCRRCNYLLVDRDGETCPECGLTLSKRNRIIGRPRTGRIAAMLVVIAGVAGVYGIGRGRVPRQGTASQWFSWLSPGLYDWAYHHDHAWLHERKAWKCQIVEIDVDSGAIVRTVYSRNGQMFPYGLQLAPDGASMIGVGTAGIVQIDLETGHTVRRVDAEASQWEEYIQVVAIGRDDAVAFVGLHGGSVQRWDFRTGVREELLRMKRGNTSTYLTLLCHPDGSRIAVFGWGETRPIDAPLEERFSWYQLRLLDAGDGSVLGELDGILPGLSGGMVMTDDFSRMFLLNHTRNTIHVIDTSDGSTIEIFEAPPRLGALSPRLQEGHLMLTQSRGGAVVPYDVATGQWVAELISPATQTVAAATLPGGRTVVSVAFDGRQGQQGWTLVVHELDGSP